ncbi:MAG: sugar transferase [Calditrichaeota bacterium]|nr:sugar transferase [Calditrichota bacterium]MCB9391565.1 sugar transferase [Calditrichota bacterium]
MAKNVERTMWMRVFHLVGDLLLTVVSFVLAFAVRTEIRSIYFFGSAQSVHNYYEIMILLVPVWWLLLDLQRSSHEFATTTVWHDFKIALRTAVFGTVGLFAAAYILRIELPPRSTMLLFMLLNASLLTVNRVFFKSIREHIRAEGGLNKRVLIIGTVEKALRFIKTIEENDSFSVQLVGFVDTERGHSSDAGVAKLLGSPDDLQQILHSHTIDEVVFAVPTRHIADCTDMLALCEQEGVRSVILSDWFSNLVAHVSTDIQYDQPVLIYTSMRHKEWQILVKRIFDIAFSSFLLILLFPLLLVIAIAIKLTDRGPVFYKWKVVGFNKEKFTGYKFRTMVTNADQIKAKLEAQNEMKGAVFKIKNDPRITPVGRHLRKFSLDELPQLWSVLKGDMSIVGPRPPLETELPRFDSWHRRKLSVKPGLTCLWQISGRSAITDFDEWVKLDLAYIDNWTLLLDFKILLKTIPAVLLGRGAH